MTTKKETVMNIALEKLVPFRDHPFQVRDDEQMQMITESIRSVGVLVPAIARPLEDGSFELISGHRRKHACEVAGLSTLPVIVRDVDQDTATVMMVDSNFQREEISLFGISSIKLAGSTVWQREPCPEKSCCLFSPTSRLHFKTLFRVSIPKIFLWV